MLLIVGLGNTGADYENTRHNVGFMVADAMADSLDKEKKYSFEKKFEADVFKVDNCLLVKPRTFMNSSGRAVRKVMDYYQIPLSNLVVIHDDLDIKMGEFKIQKAVGPKVHNGVNSVERSVGSKDFLRVRVGVDNRETAPFGGTGADYVLTRLRTEDRKQLDDVVLKIVDKLWQITKDSSQ